MNAVRSTFYLGRRAGSVVLACLLLTLVLPSLGVAQQQVTQGVVTNTPPPAPPPELQTEAPAAAPEDDGGGGTPWAGIIVAVGLVGAAGGLGSWLWIRRTTSPGTDQIAEAAGRSEARP